MFPVWKWEVGDERGVHVQIYLTFSCKRGTILRQGGVSTDLRVVWLQHDSTKVHLADAEEATLEVLRIPADDHLSLYRQLIV